MKVIVCGDYVPREDVAALIEGGDGEYVFAEIEPLLESADYNIVNYESAVNAPGDKPIKKDGMHLGSTPKAMETLRRAGFHCVTLANNHSLDYGDDALLHTIEESHRHGLDCVGAGKNLEDAAKPLVKDISGIRLAIINCCEREYTIARRNSPGANPIDPVDIYNSIRRARTDADRVLVIVHGGAEMMQLPSPRMQKLYRFFIDAGADALVNHHQHCCGGWEIYNGYPIVYGLGNLCFQDHTETDPSWYEGYMAMLEFTGDKVSFTPVPYSQCKGAPRVELADVGTFMEKAERLNRVIADPVELETRYEKWMNDTEDAYIDKFLPLRGWEKSKRLLMLRKMHLAPWINFSPTVRYMLNAMRCESHLERAIQALERHLEKE